MMSAGVAIYLVISLQQLIVGGIQSRYPGPQLCSTCKDFRYDCCEYNPNLPQDPEFFGARVCPSMVEPKRVSAHPSQDAVVTCASGTTCIDKCTWISPVSLDDNQLQCDFEAGDPAGTVCGGRLELVGRLEEGSCDVRIMDVEGWRDAGEWKCVVSSDGGAGWFADNAVLSVYGGDGSLDSAQLMAITVPLGILLLVVAATIGLTCCCCPAVIPPCCCCKRKSLPQSEAADECENESSVSLANESQVYQQVSDASSVTDDRRRSSSLPAPPPPHSRQFQSGVVYGQVSTDKGLEPRAAQKISNASVFRPYRD